MIRRFVFYSSVTIAICSTLLAGCGQSKTTPNQTTSNQVSTQTKQNPNLKNSVAYIKSSEGKQSGAASLTVDKKTHVITVAVELSGLTSKAKYSLQITSPSGTKLYKLKSVQADSKGSGTSLTYLKKANDIPSGSVIEIINGSSKTIASGKIEITKS